MNRTTVSRTVRTLPLVAGGAAAALLVAGALAAPVLPALAADGGSSAAGQTADAKETTWQERLDRDGVAALALPETYRIAFDLTVDDGMRVVRVEKAVDAQGNVYVGAGSDGLLFVRQATGYEAYALQPDGGFALVDGDLRTDACVEAASRDFEDCVAKVLPALGKAAFVGTDDVAGRTCEHYELTVGLVGFTQTFEFDVDAETGACLRWASRGSLGGHELESSVDLVCTQFETDVAELAELGLVAR